MAQEIIRSYMTKGLKELQTYIKPGTSHYLIQWSDGGQLPQELSGMYTSVSNVDTAVFNYINTQKEKIKEKKELTAKEKYYAKQKAKSEEI